MDDYGDDLMIPYTPCKENNFNPPVFNWTGFVYYMVPEYAQINWV